MSLTPGRVSTTARRPMDTDGTFTVTLDGGRPWGLRLQGGYEYAQRIRVAKVGRLIDAAGVFGDAMYARNNAKPVETCWGAPNSPTDPSR